MKRILILIRVILIPISIIYSIIILIRNKFYDLGIFTSIKIERPVISIGNITMGGTGKTPLTIFIAKYFLNKGLKIGIVSRGYKRTSKEIVTVSNGTQVNRNTEESGDELILVADELMKSFENSFFIAAGSNRSETVNYIFKKFNPGIIILDDAFQHRSIKRDLDLVLIDAQNFVEEKFLNAFTLPSGVLREHFSNLNRADLIIQNNKDMELKIIPQLEVHEKDIIVLRYKTEYFMDYKNSILQNYSFDAIVFSGIANDESFVSMVLSSGLNISEVIKYSDHYAYNSDDIDSLIGKYEKDKIFVTTEKDFIKLRQFERFVDEYPVYFLKIKIEIIFNENILHKNLDKLIK